MTQERTLRDFKVSEIIEAAEKNGLEHLHGEWLETFDGKITGGCVLGQTGFNLGVAPTDYWSDLPVQLNRMTVGEIGGQTGRIDHSLLSELNKLPNISPKWNNFPEYMVPQKLSLDEDEEDYDEPWWYVNEDAVENVDTDGLESCGHAITMWNDLASRDGKYFLPTYADVAKMVREILEPYKDRVVTLQVIDYTFGE